MLWRQAGRILFPLDALDRPSFHTHVALV
jgi:hypothetical protein